MSAWKWPRVIRTLKLPELIDTLNTRLSELASNPAFTPSGDFIWLTSGSAATLEDVSSGDDVFTVDASGNGAFLGQNITANGEKVAKILWGTDPPVDPPAGGAGTIYIQY